LALLLAALAACGTSRVVVVGDTRAAISPDQVQIYLQPPESKYQEIANLSASSGGSLTLSAADKMEKVIQRLKMEAARLGANGLLLHGVGDRAAGSLGAGISTDTNNPHTTVGMGFGASSFFFEEVGDGVAIFVEAH
jgi:hypothetical protein